MKNGDEGNPASGPQAMRATHHAPVAIGDVVVEAAILENGRRGFVQRQLTQALGFRGNTPSLRFARFCARIGANTLLELHKTASPVLLPGGQRAQWVSWEMLPMAVKAVRAAVRADKLTRQQAHIAARCEELSDALIGVGIVALIDEATGYQYGRAPDALQELFQRLIADRARDWDRRFGPDFYTPVCRLFGISYAKQHRALPDCIGQFTRAFVYEAVFPPEIVGEIKQRRGHTKLHQWLKDGGLRLLERQRDRVRDLACGSADYRDFKDRYAAAFPGMGRQIPLVLPAAGRG